MRTLLIAGVYRDGKLVEVGRVGTGFSRDKVARILPKLQALETAKSSFCGKASPRRLGEIHWVRPVLVAEIEYEGFTADGLLRQAAFKALREDKPARDVETVEPAPATTDLKEPAPAITRGNGLRASGSAVVMDVTLSHADKVLWPDANVSVGQRPQD
jgi:bifunctional non-homologous end joining protein LigD